MSVRALVIREGLEPSAYCLEGSCSIQLSYRTSLSVWGERMALPEWRCKSSGYGAKNKINGAFYFSRETFCSCLLTLPLPWMRLMGEESWKRSLRFLPLASSYL